MSEERKELHVVCGPPAGGKSVYGRKLAGELGAAFLDSDTATEAVVKAGLAAAGMSVDDRDSVEYKRHFRGAVYAVLFAMAEENLPNVPVVMAGPFTRESQEADWPERLAERFGTAVQVHFVWAEPEVRRERMVARGAARDLAKLADWEGYLESCVEGRPVFECVFFEELKVEGRKSQE